MINFKKIANGISWKIYDDLKRKECVGGSDYQIIENEGLKYKIEVDVFWENPRWFEYKVIGIGNDFKENGMDMMS